MPIGSYEEFRIIAHHDGDGYGLLNAVRGRDFEVTADEWLLEAAPFATDGDEWSRAQLWSDALIAYNIWARSVGRGSAILGNLMEAGAVGRQLETILRVIELRSLDDEPPLVATKEEYRMALLSAKAIDK